MEHSTLDHLPAGVKEFMPIFHAKSGECIRLWPLAWQDLEETRDAIRFGIRGKSFSKWPASFEKLHQNG